MGGVPFWGLCRFLGLRGGGTILGTLPFSRLGEGGGSFLKNIQTFLNSKLEIK